MADNVYIRKEGDRFIISEEGYKKLGEIVTDPVGQVYAFNNKISPVIVGAAMARLSRRMGDMREAILDEFVSVEDAELLFGRVFSGYGDDSVAQLVGQHIVVEGASNLLTKVLEWGRLMAYLEQSTRYIFFDKKDLNGKYRYFTPKLPDELQRRYTTTMDDLFDHYSHMVRGITDFLRRKYPEPEDKKERSAWLNATRAAACDAVRSVLPAATKSTVGIFSSAQALENMLINMNAHPLEEARDVGASILREAKKIIPAFMTRVDVPDRGVRWSDYKFETSRNIANLAKYYLGEEQPAPQGKGVRLISYWPPNETDLVAEILFSQSDHSLDYIKEVVSNLSDYQKAHILREYIGSRTNRRHKPGRAIEAAHFEFEIVGDYGTFRDLQRHRIVDAWEWQLLTPYFGYDLPELVVESGFSLEFHKCFEMAKELYDLLKKQGDKVVAQYAVLMGHYMRYRFFMNLREAFHMFELRTGPSGHTGYRRICNQGHDLVSSVYPIFGQGMNFVDKSDRSELGRLDAELRTQEKLSKLNDKK